MLQYMLDTNICIYVMKQRPEKLRERFDRFAEQLCISSITLGELYHGVDKSARRAENLHGLETFASRLEVLAFSPKAAAHYGQMRAELERAGRPIGPYDLLIAAHARAEGLTIVTNNTREFRRAPGLRVENWI
jgi:tRNA(fMet)-specific endonuclease VapC